MTEFRRDLIRGLSIYAVIQLAVLYICLNLPSWLHS
jgi:hypothetical protein